MKKSWHQYSKVAPKAERTSWDGIVFHSKTELQRFEFLRLMLKANQIRNLRRQVRYKLHKKGLKIENGRGGIAAYTADFVYEELGKLDDNLMVTWNEIIEDVKGYRDENSKFRIRVFESFYDCRVRIVKKAQWNCWEIVE